MTAAFYAFCGYVEGEVSFDEVVNEAKDMVLKDNKEGQSYKVGLIAPQAPYTKDFIPLFKSCIVPKENLPTAKFKELVSDLRLEAYSRLKSTKPSTRASKLEFYNANALDVLENPEKYCDEPNKTVFYADPPYWNTANYRQTTPFDYGRFIRAAKAFKYPLFVSEYNNLLGFQEIWKQRKKVTISQFDNSKNVIERLFWNRL